MSNINASRYPYLEACYAYVNIVLLQVRHLEGSKIRYPYPEGLNAQPTVGSEHRQVLVAAHQNHRRVMA